MSENNLEKDDHETTGDSEDFATMFAAYNRNMTDELRVGAKVTGEIIAVGMDTVFVNTGTKIDGAVEKHELLNADGEFPFNEGDTLELYVVGFTENEIRLSKAMSGRNGNITMLQDAYNGEIPVDGTVKAQIKGGFHVDVMNQRAFCPVSQIDARYVDMPDNYVGQSFQFLITRFEEKGRNIVVSRRELLARENEKKRAEFLETLKVGDVVQGRVVKLMPYGAFVELGPAVEGMCHVSELSWSRVEKPEDAVKPNDVITVKVLDIKPGKEAGQLKISLSIKQVDGDPFDQEIATMHRGDRMRGRVTRLADFGAFVELAPGVEGLVHISEMSYVRRVVRPADVVAPGQEVDVLIKEIDAENRRISLSIRDAQGDPWAGVEEKYQIGQRMDGRLERRERFGLFISLEPGITGLMPRSKMSRSAKPDDLEKIKTGEMVPVLIEEIHPEERRITLAPSDIQEEEDWRQYAAKPRKEGGEDRPSERGREQRPAGRPGDRGDRGPRRDRGERAERGPRAEVPASVSGGGGALSSLGELIQEALKGKK